MSEITTEIPIGDGRDAGRGQSPSGAGVTAPGLLPKPSDAANRAAASAFLAGRTFNISDLWTRAKTTWLVELWFQGLSTAAIGKIIKISKNAVVGRAHRLELPGRVSPIIRSGARRATRPVSIIPPLPPLLSADLTAQHNVVVPTPTLPPPPPQPPPPTPELRAVSPAPRPTVSCVAPLRLVPPAPPPTVFRPRALAPCLWPFGDPGSKSFRYCGDPGVVGKPYCPVHMRKAYVPAPRRVH